MYAAEKFYRYRANAFLARVHLGSLDEVTQETVDQFRADTTDLSPSTVEAYIKAISILTKRKFTGKKLRKRNARPKQPVPLEDLSRVYRAAQDDGNRWACDFLRYCYITGFRHHDLTRMHRSCVQSDRIELEASKTKHFHIIPRHFILSDPIPDDEQPFYRNEKTVRLTLRKYCDRAGVPYFTPRRLRVTAINAYERAYPGAGAVIQGIALGTTLFRSYMDQFQFLYTAQLSLAIPDAMLPRSKVLRKQIEERRLLESWNRLPEEDRAGILRMVRKMA